METNHKDNGAMNIRGIDMEMYNNFKSTLYKEGYRSVKSAILDLMVKFIDKHKTN